MRRKGAGSSERGVTIALVALTIVVWLVMAALAIDVVTLYVARSEAQRAADAGALAAARMFAGTGFTSAPTSWTVSDICQSGGAGASAAANSVAEAVAAQNQVSGLAATVQSISCNVTSTGNPRITVAVQRTGLPIFFARIWGRLNASVNATATAEAYNASAFSTPITLTGVKPWLLPNCDPNHTSAPANTNCGGTQSYFVNPTNGSVVNNGSFIGQTITITHSTPLSAAPNAGQYYRLDIPVNPPTGLCPSSSPVSCGSGPTSDYRENISCHSTESFSCGQLIGAGQTVTVLPGGGGFGPQTNDGIRCLIHAGANGLGQGQDVYSGGSGTPIRITGGNNNPNPDLQGVTNISRSDSVVTVPLYDGSNLCPSGTCSLTAPIQGFLQLGITQDSSPPNGQFQAVILNAVGCNPGATGTAVSGGGISPVPVRLISQ